MDDQTRSIIRNVKGPGTFLLPELPIDRLGRRHSEICEPALSIVKRYTVLLIQPTNMYLFSP